MKNYPRVFEYVFTSDRKINRIDVKKIKAANGLNRQEYRDFYYKAIREFDDQLFKNFVKLKWLSFNFVYKDRRKKPGGPSGRTPTVEHAYSVFMKNYLNYDTSFFHLLPFSALASYIKTFFPNFLEESPFDPKYEDKYKIPYKHIAIPHLILVSFMEERMELLEKAEKEKMSYAEFCDFIINYIGCFNEEKGYEYYKWQMGSAFYPTFIKTGSIRYGNKPGTKPKKKQQKA